MSHVATQACQRESAFAREAAVEQLYRASIRDDATAVLTALLNGADPRLANRDGHLPLVVACATGHADNVRELLKHGAPVNASHDFLGHATRELMTGFTPLHAACSLGSVVCVQLLLKAGAAVKLKAYHGIRTSGRLW